MRCEQVSRLLAECPDGPLPDLAAREHLSTCLRCQAEAVQYRRLLRALRSLSREVVPPGAGLVPAVLVALEEGGERRAAWPLRSGRRTAYLVGVGAATAAGAAGAALVLAARSRGRRLAG